MFTPEALALLKARNPIPDSRDTSLAQKEHAATAGVFGSRLDAGMVAHHLQRRGADVSRIGWDTPPPQRRFRGSSDGPWKDTAEFQAAHPGWTADQHHAASLKHGTQGQKLGSKLGIYHPRVWKHILRSAMHMAEANRAEGKPAVEGHEHYPAIHAAALASPAYGSNDVMSDHRHPHAFDLSAETAKVKTP